jgi:pimeloyl-ACP methyl ester carboxylesterase
MQHPTRRVENGPISTAYLDHGEGEPLLFLHGYTGSKLDFHDQLGWFDGYRVIAPDHRGHGETSHADAYTFPLLVDDFLRFVRALGLPKVHLLGHSLGGMVAMRAVLEAPEQFRSLILMDTSPSPLSLTTPETRERIAGVMKDSGPGLLVAAMQAQKPSRRAQRGIDFLGAKEHWRRIELKLAQMHWQAFRDLGNELFCHQSALGHLSAIKCPTTVLVGDGDRPFIEPSEAMAREIAGSRLVVIPDAEHCPQYENAQAWKIAVQKHLDDARKP